MNREQAIANLIEATRAVIFALKDPDELLIEESRQALIKALEPFKDA